MVITGLTRNQFAGNGTRVRIPPSPPKKRSNFWWTKVTSFFIQAAGLVYHHVLACISSPQGVYHQPKAVFRFHSDNISGSWISKQKPHLAAGSYLRKMHRVDGCKNRCYFTHRITAIFHPIDRRTGGSPPSPAPGNGQPPGSWGRSDRCRRRRCSSDPGWEYISVSRAPV